MKTANELNSEEMFICPDKNEVASSWSSCLVVPQSHTSRSSCDTGVCAISTPGLAASHELLHLFELRATLSLENHSGWNDFDNKEL